MKKLTQLNFILVTAIAIVALPACKKTGSSNDGTNATPSTVTVPAPLPPVAEDTSIAGVRRPPGPRPRVTVAPANARSDELWKLGQQGLADMRAVCSRGYQGGEKQAASVSHYYIAPGSKVGDYNCKNGFAYFGQPAMAGSCLHPCRALAADPRYHRPGEVIYFKSLVGVSCGSGRNKIIHDGFMVVTDNGNPDVINTEGRFGFFWGRCEVEQNGFCLDEGAIAIDFALTFSPYCRAWRPQDPLFHDNIKLSVYNTVRSEAVRRGDHLAASRFDLDALIGLGVDQNGLIFRRGDN